MFRGIISVFLMLAVTLSNLDFNDAKFEIKFPERFYVASLHQRAAGDVLATDGGHLILMKDNDNGFYVQKGEWSHKWTTVVETRVGGITSYMKVIITDGLQPETSIALAQRLVGKRLPYGNIVCNEMHYMRYILGSGPHTPRFNRNCLTALPLNGVTPADINSDQFMLRNGNNDFFALSSGFPRGRGICSLVHSLPSYSGPT